MLAHVIELTAGDARASVLPDDGGRLASLVIDGHELLVTGDATDDPKLWGSWPMVPYAGRVRDGHFDHDGVTYDLPLSLPPHAAHGTVLDQSWTARRDGGAAVELSCQLGPHWPLGGRATQSIELFPDSIRCRLAVIAAERSMPAEIGWHAFYRCAEGIEQSVRAVATAMYERGVDGLPTGRLVAPTRPPWDDCFAVDGAVEFGAGPLAVTVTSDAGHLVVFDGMDFGVAVEPQSGPPDAFHLAPRVLAPGECLERTMIVSWRSADAPAGR
jgi:aldose 1-epimerase